MRDNDSKIEVAFILHKEILYYARYSYEHHCPSSAVIKLIQGIFDQNRDLSFFILRNRIYTTEKISTMVQGMVKLTAKRISSSHAKDQGIQFQWQKIEIGNQNQEIYQCTALLPEPEYEIPSRIESDAEAMLIVQTMAQTVPRGGSVRHDMNRPIAALIVDSQGYPLSWATNSALFNKTLHAELKAVQSYYLNTKQGLPENCRIYVSTKPCLMCAGVIVDSALNPDSLSVIYAENDPGPKAHNTALEKIQRQYR